MDLTEDGCVTLFLTRLLFEDLSLLLIAEVIAITIALAVHRRRFTAKSRRGIWITLVFCALFIGLQHLVVTDREHIERQVRTLARAVDDGDLQMLGQALDAGFTDGQRDREAFLADVDQFLQRAEVDEVTVGWFKIAASGDTASAAFTARCDYRRGNQIHSGIPSRWELVFVRRDGDWKLQRIVSATFGPGGLIHYHDAWRY